MKILFLGDIVGKVGRNQVCDLLDNLKVQYNPDLIIANAENSAHGKGITSNIYNQLISFGIDYITMGNHTYSKREIYDFIDNADRLIVPDNIKEKKGVGYRVFNICDLNICIINLLGKNLMGDYMNDPVISMKKILKDINDKNIDIILVDFHAESTAEKRIFFEIFKNDIDIFVGTHTHVQTADDDIIDGHAYISDVGMCGPYKSVIGRDINESIDKYLNNNKSYYTPSNNNAIICGVFIDVNKKHKINKFERIQIRP